MAELSLYDIETLKKVKTLDNSMHTKILRIKASPCGRMLAQEQNQNLTIWDVQSGCKIFEQDISCPYTHCFTTDLMIIESFNAQEYERDIPSLTLT